MGLEGGGARAGNTLPEAVAVASVAFLGAFRPFAVHNSILAASDSGVNLDLDESSALLAAIAGVSLDGAGSAEFVAGGSGPSGPLGELAVDGASLGVALAAVGKLGADGATVVGELDNGTGASLLTSAAGLGAGTVSTPLADVAVDRALVDAALASLRHDGADTTAELGSSDEGALTRLASGAAGLGALGETAEGRSTAIDGASLGVASTGLGKGRAGLATVQSEDGPLAQSFLATAATGLGADAPGAELGYFAIDGAKSEVACGLLLKRRALDTTTGSFSDNVTEAGLFAATAGLGAEAVGTP